MSSHVQQELTALHSRRIALFNELHAKDSPTQREIAHQEFQLQTNQLALSLLNVSQRAVVNQIQLRQIGLQSLLRPEIRATLALSDSQLQLIQALSQQRMQLSQGATAIEHSQLFVMVERRIYATLNDNQRQSWLRLIGTDEVPVALVQDEDPKETTPTDEDPEETPPTEPASTEPSADASAKPPAEPASTEPSEEPASTEPSEEPADEGKPAEGTEPEENTSPDPAPPKGEPDPPAEPTVNNKSETILNAKGEIEIRFAFTFTP
ncbi:MAG TPA: hypothetical protein EYM79_08370, partial [Planctomycetes bacterium]|nr:hypothetical protein [Planctomycetota bacterium]